MKLLVLAVLVLAVFSTEFETSLEQLQETQFGQTILQTIQMELQTEDPVVSNLVDMMYNLDQQLDVEQKRDDDRLARISQNCDIEIGQLTEIINQNTVNSITLKSELDTLTPQKAQAVANLERKVNEIKDLKGELEYQTLKRDTENKTYQVILDNLEQALFGVNQVKGYFNKYLDVLVKNRRRFDKPEPSFLEELSFKYEEQPEEDDEPTKITSFAQVAQKVNKLKHHIKLEGYKSLLEIMSSLANQAHSQQDEASEAEVLSRKLLAILKQVEGYIQTERIREDQAEQARVSAFTALKQMLTDQLVQANQDRTFLEGMIQSLSTKIASATNEKFEVDLKVTNKSREKEDREVDCRLKRVEYDVDTKSRIGQKKSIAVAVDLITSKLGQLKRALLAK
ncbi:hypothetical protein pb186bvf_011582 [Paramecium bursaria]